MSISNRRKIHGILRTGRVGGMGWSAVLLVGLQVARLAHSDMAQPVHHGVPLAMSSTTMTSDGSGLSSNFTTSLPIPIVASLPHTRTRATLEGFVGGQCSVRHNVSCLHVTNATCFGVPLPYEFISLDLARSPGIWHVTSQLRRWESLRVVPKCWSVIQPLLCAVLMPPCEGQGVQLVSHQLCKVARGPCRVVPQLFDWPDYLQCNDSSIFEAGCDYRRKIRFNHSSQCPEGLVQTEHEPAFFPGIDGCGLKCRSPLFSSSEYHTVDYIKVFIVVLCGLVVTFSASTHIKAGYKSIHRYPGVIVFFMTLCWLGIVGGFIIGLVTDESDIPCNSDGTAITGPHDHEGHQACYISFFFAYYFFVAHMVWYVILNYCWYFVATDRTGRGKDALQEKIALFHLSTWSLALIMTILVITTNTVEADILFKVCFVSRSNFYARLLAVILPMILTLIISLAMAIKTLQVLVPISTDVNQAVEKRAKIGRRVREIAIFVSLVSLCLIFNIYHEFYPYLWRNSWNSSLEGYILCKIKKLGVDLEQDFVSTKCELEDRPNIMGYKFVLISIGVGCIAVHTWLMNRRTWNIWRGKSASLVPKAKTYKFKKSNLIQKVYQDRHRLERDGRLSMSLQSFSQAIKPVEMKIEKDESSEEFNTSFAAALPRLVQRRNALTGLEDMVRDNQLRQSLRTSSSAIRIKSKGKRKGRYTSNDSSCSISIQSNRLSFANFDFSSRRQSFDSQLSIQPHELRHLQELYDKKVFKKRSKRNFFKGKRPRRLKRTLSITSRNSNMTSTDQSGVSQILPAITLDPSQLSDFPSMASSMSGLTGIEMKSLRQLHIAQTGSPKHKELKDKLALLASVSQDPIEVSTKSSKAENRPAIEPSKDNTLEASVQTSVTDLSQIGLTRKFRAPLPQMHHRGRRGGIADHGLHLLALKQTLDEGMTNKPSPLPIETSSTS
eukprot:TCALIF_05948-PA protein Name:"Similar to SMO Smoothened homolog (Homo sapiens)" AED:0.09 eAED:0.09 QI:0/0/0/0.33/1/1/3/0/947